MARLAADPVAAIYSSPYPRAGETVEPLAADLGLPIGIEPDLRERLLAPAAHPDWMAHLERSFADPDHRLPGGESAAEATMGSVARSAPSHRATPAGRWSQPVTAT